MARPQKTGLDYFPHDVDAMHDSKLEPTFHRFGAAAYAFYFLHLEYCYRSDDLCIDISDTEAGEEMRDVIQSKLKITPEEYTNILKSFLRHGAFDVDYFESTGKLTSNGVKKRAGVVTKRRVSGTNETTETIDNTDSDVSVTETTQKPRRNQTETQHSGTQTKEKKTKEKESKVNRDTENICPAENEKTNTDYKKIISRLNTLAGTSFRASAAQTQKFIKARIKDGYTESDLITVVEKMCYLWNRDPPKGEKDMRPYLRPETLFGNKFEGYLNRAVPKREIDPFSFEALGIPIDREMEVF